MTFEIELAGTRRTVSLEPDGAGRYRATLDGHTHVVAAERIGEFGLSLIVGERPAAASPERLPVASRDLQLVPGTAPGELLVAVAGRTVAVSVNGRRAGRQAADVAAAHGEQAVTAPMPGRVVRVLVGVGDVVTLRQPVVVVEAMKMENELRSPKAGTVKDVSVAPGLSVEAGRVLVVIE